MLSIKKLISCVVIGCASVTGMSGQERLYSNAFPLGQVQLADGPLKEACELNVRTLLQYDTDRLLAPFLKEAGLTPKGESFDNWKDLDGHVGGHYLTALAIHYAVTGNEECKRRMNYMIAELKRCQQAHGNGYVGGVPKGMECWEAIRRGDVGIVWKYWVPWYNIHKIYAGLRDAWSYGRNEEARQMFLDLCDWGLTVIAPLNDTQMEQMLDNEFGGMNEVYADAATYDRAAAFFWHTVADTRSLALGGNSRREHFATQADCRSYVEDREGPESCNTNNMLKLTEGLFRMHPEARYADFYERAMYNHILSTQHPEHGGYVYFTSARPAHYRVYSAPNQAMWCCVGTGMENHGKYGEFIYTHTGDSLYVNLFAASRLDWKEKGLQLTQETEFPAEGRTRLTIRVKKPVRMKLLVRHPGWCADGSVSIRCKDKEYAGGSLSSSYVVIDRKWKDGDVVEIHTPMQVRVEELPNVPEYIALMRGPILLGARMGTDDLHGLVANDGRWSHIAHGSLVSVFDTPFLIGSREEIVQKLSAMRPVEGKSLCYTVPGLFEDKYKDLVLEPFYRIHDCRYMMYWLSMTEDEHREYLKQMQQREEARLALDRRTVDAVAMGEQQPEVDHQLKYENSTKGHFNGEAFRDATDGHFEYTLNTKGETALTLMLRYWGNETGNRTFDICIDGEVLATENLSGKWKRESFVDVEYPIPAAFLEGKRTVTVSFRSHAGHVAGGVYFLRLVRNAE